MVQSYLHLFCLPGKRPPKDNEIPRGIVIHICGGRKSWANEEITKIWLARIWGRNNQSRRLLTWDTFAGHKTAHIKSVVREEYNSDLAFIPPGCTSKLQPADVSWNAPFKRNLEEQYDEWVFSGSVEYTKKTAIGDPPPPPQ